MLAWYLHIKCSHTHVHIKFTSGAHDYTRSRGRRSLSLSDLLNFATPMHRDFSFRLFLTESGLPEMASARIFLATLVSQPVLRRSYTLQPLTETVSA